MEEDFLGYTPSPLGSIEIIDLRGTEILDTHVCQMLHMGA